MTNSCLTLFLPTVTFLAASSSGQPPHGQQYFKVKPHDKQLIEGKDEIELECHVANLMGQVQWSKDGFLLGKEWEERMRRADEKSSSISHVSFAAFQSLALLLLLSFLSFDIYAPQSYDLALSNSSSRAPESQSIFAFYLDIFAPPFLYYSY